jgi:PPOX class probable F420-dependent enzyme
MAAKMTREQIHAFLTEGARTGKLATTRADGRPHVAPVWFVFDGEDVLFMTNEQTVKGKSLRRDPRAALCVDAERPPFAFVLIEGTVTIEDDPEAALPVSIELARRYMGEELAEQFGRRNAVPGELLVRLHPAKIIAIDAIAD